MSELTTKPVARADREPTLADATEDYRKLRVALWVMEDLGCSTLGGAIEKARARVRGARRRQSYDHKD